MFVFLDQYNKQIFKNNNTNIGVIYRNYNNSNREKELIKIAKACKKKDTNFLYLNDIKLAIKVKADGIYIPSFNKTKRFTKFRKKKLIILGSAHNQKEIGKKYHKMFCNFLSPAVFYVKKSKNFLVYINLIFYHLLTKLNI